MLEPGRYLFHCRLVRMERRGFFEKLFNDKFYYRSVLDNPVYQPWPELADAGIVFE